MLWLHSKAVSEAVAICQFRKTFHTAMKNVSIIFSPLRNQSGIVICCICYLDKPQIMCIFTFWWHEKQKIPQITISNICICQEKDGAMALIVNIYDCRSVSVLTLHAYLFCCCFFWKMIFHVTRFNQRKNSTCIFFLLCVRSFSRSH